MNDTRHGKLISEGKTKKIFAIDGNDTEVIVEYKNAITAFDDPSFTKEFATKAKYSNTTTCRAFEMLTMAGISNSFVRQINDTEFIAKRCNMIPLEVVARRFAYGSYLKRNPQFATNGAPHKFDTPIIEFFLKTTRGSLVSDDNIMVENLDPKNGEEDPMIANPFDAQWRLIHPKKMPTDADSDLGRVVDSAKVLRGASMQDIADITTKAFEKLEKFFENHGFHLVDFKIEFGIGTDGTLMISDVIDNDSWRLRDTEWRDVSKQSFRDGEDIATVEHKYELVATLLEEGVNK